jgi:hypothetical protein
MGDLVLPAGALTVGDEIARGSFGVACTATLYGEDVIAKVRRRRRRRRRRRWLSSLSARMLHGR